VLFLKIFQTDNSVRVWFTGAMGLDEEMAIDFKLETAQKVKQFVEELFKVGVSSLDLYASNINKPLYTISPLQIFKKEVLLPEDNDADIQMWETTISIHRQVAHEHPRLQPFFAYLLCYFDLGFGTWNSMRLEVIGNIYSPVRKVPLLSVERELFIQLGQEKLAAHP
jgi:hypothetical protein